MAEDLEGNISLAGIEYFPDPTKGAPVYFGSVYIGFPDTDPQFNQIPVYAVQENGIRVRLPQPLITGAGGVVLYNGSPVPLVADGAYSIKVLNKAGAQVYYLPSVFRDTAPVTIVNTAFAPASFDLNIRLLNTHLIAPTGLFQDYYDANKPVLDFGTGITPAGSVGIEIIPDLAFDLAQGDSIIDLED